MFQIRQRLLPSTFILILTNYQTKTKTWLRLLVVRCNRLESDHVEFVEDKVALDQIFFQCFGFALQLSFHQLIHTHQPQYSALYNGSPSGQHTKWTQPHLILQIYNHLTVLWYVVSATGSIVK